VDEEEDEEEEDEEEEDEEGVVHGSQQPGQRHTRHHLQPPTPVQSTRTSPTSSGAPRTPRDIPAIVHFLQKNPPSPLSVAGGKVRMVRQWTPRTAHV
jgi:hypothetical protein